MRHETRVHSRDFPELDLGSNFPLPHGRQRFVGAGACSACPSPGIQKKRKKKGSLRSKGSDVVVTFLPPGSSNWSWRVSNLSSPHDSGSNDYNHHYDPKSSDPFSSISQNMGENVSDHSGDYSRKNRNRAENSDSIPSSSVTDQCFFPHLFVFFPLFQNHFPLFCRVGWPPL